MSDPQPPSGQTGSTPAASTTAQPASASANYKVPERNPALRMLGLPALPKKLPSRNWMIFWTLTAGFSAAIIYDKREKKRATARWARAVSPLATEPISDPSQLPRKLTVMLAAPPGEGLRSAQDHFIEYVKPILAASGLDWDFVQGRQQGDVRAAVAEKIRRKRKLTERPEEELLPTEDNLRDAVRQKNGLEEFKGDAGDIVIGRSAWKEYIRGIHEGWLGPLDPPVQPEAATANDTASPTAASSDDADAKPEEKKEGGEDKKPERPPQPIPHNTVDDYESSALPPTLPERFSPSTPIQFPHILGFLSTFKRMGWFLNRRKLADDIGREVAAVCFAAHREWNDNVEPSTEITYPDDNDGPQSRNYPQNWEQQHVLVWEEKNWVKTVWQDEEETKPAAEGEEGNKEPLVKKEKIWPRPVVVDPRIAGRMRRFELLPEHEEQARAIVVPEKEVEGWVKGMMRSLGVWGMGFFESKPTGPNVGNVDDE